LFILVKKIKLIKKLFINQFPEIARSEIISFEGYSIFLRNDHIIQLQFKAGFSGELDDAINIINTIKKLSNGIRYPLLVIYADGNLFSKENREYVAGNEISNYVKADALVMKSLALKIIGNFYLKFNKPLRPTRMFVDTETAVQWLKEQ
jgi:hypothetical protein